MNFARTTLDTQLADPSALRAMVRDHALTPIAETWPFSSVGAYALRFVKPRHTGNAALDRVSVSNRLPNYNNIVYVGVSDQYLHDDLAFVKDRPGTYARAVIDAAKVWILPPDEYFELQTNRSHLSSWANLFDRTLLLRPAADPQPVATAVYYVGWLPSLTQISYMTALVDAVALAGTPFFLRRKRKTASPALAGTLLYVWVTVAYAFAVTSLVELGENQRFAMELGPLPLLATCVLLWSTLGSMRRSSVSAASPLREWDRNPDRPGALVRRSNATTSNPPGHLTRGDRAEAVQTGQDPAQLHCLDGGLGIDGTKFEPCELDPAACPTSGRTDSTNGRSKSGRWHVVRCGFAGFTHSSDVS